MNARTLEVYVSKIGTAGTWTKVENTTLITDQSGTTIQLKAPEDAQFVKIHSAWDERNGDNESVDNSSVTGKPDDLIEVWSTVNGQATSYSYDGLGNRLSTTTNTAGTTSATYYPNTSAVKTNGIWEYNYDPNGNLIARGTEGSWDDNAKSYTWSATSGELWNYAYDLKNRLVEVKHSTAGSGGLRLVADYSYDMRDLRVVTTKPEGTTYYQYDNTGDLIWKSEAGNSTKYIQALGETWAEVRSTASGSATYYHHTDHEGSTELITDANGKVVWSGSYEAFGKLSRSNGGLEFDASYTGKQVDPDTGLYYFNARWYDPNLGRFITEDPARDGDNWFDYCGDDPLSRFDPTGLDGIDFKGAFSFIGSLFTNAVSGDLHSGMENPILTGISQGMGDTAQQLRSGVDKAADVAGYLGAPGALFDAFVKGEEGNYKGAALSLATVPLAALPGGKAEATGATKGLGKLLAKEAEESSAKAAENVATQTTKTSGAYFLKFEDGFMYAGKGPLSRMNESIRRIEGQGYKLLEGGAEHFPTATAKEGFIKEYQLMKETGQLPRNIDPNSMLLNKIWSPGKKLLGE